MAPFSRFQVSPYKNALPTPTPASQHLFPPTTSAHSAAAIAGTDDWVLVSSGSDVLAVGWEDQGKGFQHERRSWNAGVGEIIGLTVQPDAWVAVCGRSGVAIFVLPSAPFEAPERLISLPPAASVSAHPTAPSLVLAHLAIVSLDSIQPVLTLEAWTDKGVWATCWSFDGRFVCGVGKDGSVAVWDPRKSTSIAGKTTSVLNPLKPATCNAFGAYFLITGFSKSRERIVLVVDPLSPSDAPLASSTLDYETAALLPVIDQDRAIVYLAGRGDSIVKYSEFTKGSFAWSAVGLGAPVEHLALAPWTKLNVIKGEINRLLILSKQGDVIPVPVIVPQRFYIDFNEATNPPVRATDDGQSVKAWLDGGDHVPRVISRDPAKRKAHNVAGESSRGLASSIDELTRVGTPASLASTAKVESQAKLPVPTEHLTSMSLSTPTDTLPLKSLSSSVTGKQPTATDTPPAPSGPPTVHATRAADSLEPTIQPASTASSAAQVKPPTAATPAARWSRNFLAGSTPLLPAHDNLDYVSSSYPAEFPLLLATSRLLLFPVSGSGGRIAVHSRQARGRMPLVGDVATLEVGSELVDLTLDPVEIDSTVQVVTAGKDGKLKIWSVPSASGLAASVHEPIRVVDAPGLDKVAKLTFSPTVKHLLAVASSDFGEGVVRVVDTQRGVTLLKEKISDQGLFSLAWSPSGAYLAVACKDRQIRVLDPRSPSRLLSVASHDSPRGVQLVWISETQLLSVGHAAGSTRQLRFYSIEGDALRAGASLSLDVSPAVLFPHYDPDTSILWLWCKGSSTVLSFDVQPANVRQPFVQLPPFTVGSLQNGIAFLPKTDVDVRSVEVLRALRLTTREVQEVSWKVPRRHTERFQDDVYPPTRGLPAGTPEEWLAGEISEPSCIDLRPTGMENLSEMPKSQPTAVKEKPKIGARELTTAEKAEQSMNALFEKAKNDLDSDEEERIKGDEEWSD